MLEILPTVFSRTLRFSSFNNGILCSVRLILSKFLLKGGSLETRSHKDMLCEPVSESVR
jgi:hypothetical protein